MNRRHYILIALLLIVPTFNAIQEPTWIEAVARFAGAAVTAIAVVYLLSKVWKRTTSTPG